MASVSIPATEIFRSELAEARRLGFQLQLLTTEPGIAAARLVPTSDRARAACERHGEGDAIQASCALEDENDRLDSTRDTIRKALAFAREALA